MKTLFSKNQLLLLRLFYTNPQKSYYMQEIGRMIGKEPGVFQRTLNGLVREELLKSEYRAHARYFQANTRHPLYSAFKKIVTRTVGIESSLRQLVSRLKVIKLAILYGSFAKGGERPDSDIDLLIVGQKPAFLEDRLLSAISALERKIQREINYKIYSLEEYRKKISKGDPFLQEILRDQKIVLKGDADVV